MNRHLTNREPHPTPERPDMPTLFFFRKVKPREGFVEWRICVKLTVPDGPKGLSVMRYEVPLHIVLDRPEVAAQGLRNVLRNQRMFVQRFQ